MKGISILLSDCKLRQLTHVGIAITFWWRPDVGTTPILTARCNKANIKIETMFRIHSLVLQVCWCGIMTWLSSLTDDSSGNAFFPHHKASLKSVFYCATVFPTQRGVTKEPLGLLPLFMQQIKVALALNVNIHLCVWPVCDISETELNQGPTFTTSMPLTNRCHWCNSPSSESIKQCCASFIVVVMVVWSLSFSQKGKKRCFTETSSHLFIITFATSCLHMLQSTTFDFV